MRVSNSQNAEIIYSNYLSTLADSGEIDSGWIDMAGVDKVQISARASASGMTINVSSRATDPDGASGETALETPVTYTDGAFYLANIITRQRYMRFQWQNNTGSGVTDASLEIKQTFGSSDKLSVFPVGVNPSAFSQAALVQSIDRGQQPDGDYVTVKADGQAVITQTNLGGTLLNGAVNISQTTITVDDTSNFASSGTIGIDDELISYTGKTATTFTGCTRGVLGTAASTHLDNEPVGEAYVGDWIDSDGWDTIELFIDSEQPSKLLGLTVQFTDDANVESPTIRGERRFTYSEEDVETGFDDIRIPAVLDGFRAIYVNGSSSQTSFFFDVTLRTSGSTNRYNNGGALITADFETEVALGLVSNFEIGTKFGSVRDIDAGDDAVDVWAYANDALASRVNTKTFPSTASTFYLVSDSASDTSVTVRVTYLDANFFEREETVSLNGTTAVALQLQAIDVNRMFVNSSTGAVGRVYCATANNFTAGVPNTPSQVVAFIPIGYNQTQQTQFTVPAKKRLIIKRFLIQAARAGGANGSADVSLRIKINGQAPRIIREFFVSTGAPVDKDKANIVLPEKTQVVWRLDDVSDNNTNCTVIWDYELIDD